MKSAWTRRKIGSILQLEYGKPLSDSDRARDGLYPVYGASGEKTRTNRFYHDKPSIVVGRKGSAGELTITEPKFWPLDVTYFVTFDARQHDLQFLYHLLSTLDLPRLAKGVKPGINRNEVYSKTASIPALTEQQRIVAILAEAFDGIATAKAHAEQCLTNAHALNGHGFIGLTSQSEQHEWLQTTVSSIAAPTKGSIRTGPFGSQLLHSEFVDDGVAVLGIDNAVANEFRWGRDRFITQAKYRQLERYRVYPGDVLITIMGTCGRCAIVPDDIPIAINTKHLCCITLDSSKCLPGYLHAYFLHHPLAQAFLARNAKGAIMEGLNMGLIQELPVLLPPLSRQRELVSSFDQLRDDTNRLADLYGRKIAALEALKKSLLHQAFNGEL